MRSPKGIKLLFLQFLLLIQQYWIGILKKAVYFTNSSFLNGLFKKAVNSRGRSYLAHSVCHINFAAKIEQLSSKLLKELIMLQPINSILILFLIDFSNRKNYKSIGYKHILSKQILSCRSLLLNLKLLFYRSEEVLCEISTQYHKVYQKFQGKSLICKTCCNLLLQTTVVRFKIDRSFTEKLILLHIKA